MHYLREVIDAAVSYFAAIFALIASLPLMKIGGAILLIARLIVDLPPAYIKIKEWVRAH